MKFLSSCIEFVKHVQFKVGDGRRIRFCEDLWIGNSTLAERFPLLYRVVESKKVCISSQIYRDNYQAGWLYLESMLRNLKEREMDQVSDLFF